MAKRIVQDVLPPHRRSIRNIPLPENRTEAEIRGTREKRRVQTEDSTVVETKEARRPEKIKVPKSELETLPRSKRSSNRFVMWTGVTVCLAVLGYALSFLFVSATVTVIPKEKTLPINITATAEKSPTNAELGFTIVTITREGNKEVPASGEEKVERKASGKILIYNNYSSAPQTLVKNTRFETSDGLIFRIESQVTVPGQKTVNGEKNPGSVSATVIADEAGEEYNIGLADFTIPGFKGDPRFASFNAKSDPQSPIGGGFIGTVKKVTQADMTAAQTAIQTQLKNELLTSVEPQIPETHVLFSDAAIFSFEQLPQEEGSDDKTAKIRQQGTVYGILFSKDQLNNYVAAKRLEEEKGESPISIANLNELTFQFKNKSTFDPKSSLNVEFSLTGNARFVWDINSDMVSKALAKQKRRDIKNILINFSEIDKANVVVRPVWVGTLPKNQEKIKVVVSQP